MQRAARQRQHFDRGPAFRPVKAAACKYDLAFGQHTRPARLNVQGASFETEPLALALLLTPTEEFRVALRKSLMRRGVRRALWQPVDLLS